MHPLRLYAVTGDAVARLENADGTQFDVTLSLEGSGAQCLAVDPRDPNRVYVGTDDDGLYRTLDGGETWAPAGDSIPHRRVLSVAVSPSHHVNGRSVVYAGTEPSQLYRSEDDGQTWREFPGLPALPSAPTWSFPPRPWTNHVRWIALHHTDPNLIFVGIELGGVMRSTDGGETWEDRKPGSYHDSHALATHPTAPERVYEAAGEGVAASTDAGDTWQPVDTGMDRHYSWGLAVDPGDPDLWYVSASFGPRQAHSERGDSQAVLYRKRGQAPWRPLGNGAPLHHPHPVMPYALLTLPDRPNSLLVGLRNGEVLLTEDAGETFQRLDARVPGILALAGAA